MYRYVLTSMFSLTKASFLYLLPQPSNTTVTFLSALTITSCGKTSLTPKPWSQALCIMFPSCSCTTYRTVFQPSRAARLLCWLLSTLQAGAWPWFPSNPQQLVAWLAHSGSLINITEGADHKFTCQYEANRSCLYFCKSVHWKTYLFSYFFHGLYLTNKHTQK